MRQYHRMKAVIDLNDGLLRRAEVEAKTRGITVSDLLRQALIKELDAHPHEQILPSELGFVQFPIFKSKAPGTLKITPEVISALDKEEDKFHLQLAG